MSAAATQGGHNYTGWFSAQQLPSACYKEIRV